MTGNAASAALLVGALGDVALGDPRRLHPVAGFGRIARHLEALLWRPSRAAGAVYACALVGSAAAAALVAECALRRKRWGEPALAALTVWTVLGGSSLAREGKALARLVEDGELEAARRRMSALVGRDPAELDGPELCRAALESVAENTTDAVVAPLFWHALAGPAGAVAYRAANTLDAHVGHRDERYLRFGWAAARLDDLLTWPAARLAALLAVAVASLAGGEARLAWRTLRRDGRAHPSPNAGLIEATFAGALGVQLGGINRYGGQLERRPQLGDGGRPEPVDLRRAVRLSRLVGASSALACAALAWSVRR